VIDPLGLFGVSTGFDASAAAFGFGGTTSLYGNFSHNPNKPWYQGWSSSVTFSIDGGVAASVYGFGAGVHLGANDSCHVSQLNDGYLGAGRLGLGAFSVGGYKTTDGKVTGGGVTIGPTFGYIGAIAGAGNTWTLGGGDW